MVDVTKSTVKIKHLGIWSTSKFIGTFCFIFSILMLLVWGSIFAVIMGFSLLLGLGFGGSDALVTTLLGAGFGIATFLFSAVAFVIVYTIVGFIVGAIMSIAFNLVVKMSGGLSYDAEIS